MFKKNGFCKHHKDQDHTCLIHHCTASASQVPGTCGWCSVIMADLIGLGDGKVILLENKSRTPHLIFSPLCTHTGGCRGEAQRGLNIRLAMGVLEWQAKGCL